MRPKAAATPMATTPDPYSRPIAIMVAAAALDVEVDDAVAELPLAAAELPLEAVGVAVAELELVVAAAAVKFVAESFAQFLALFCVQTFWAARSFSPAVIQLE